MPRVNPEILRWARETAGFDLEEASQKLRILDIEGVSAVNRLAALEAGKSDPTRAMLVKMAKQYHRPLLVFYMSAPPKTGNRGEDFRTLPKEYSESSEALLNALIRDVQVRQSIIRAVLEDEDEAVPLPFVGSMDIADGVTAVLASIRNTIDVDLTDFRAQPTADDAFALLRTGVESAGVFVLLMGDLGSHHTAIAPETFRGFTIADRIAPFIVINDGDSRAAWSFTLLHELVHIWLGQTGVSSVFSEKEIEKFCNEVASEFLLPKQELAQLNVNSFSTFDDLQAGISEFARAKNVSNSMVAYKLYLTGVITQPTWSRLSEAYREWWHKSKEEQRTKARAKVGGPNYYTVRRHRIGGNLIALVQRMMAAGALTTVKAGKVLGVKAQNVQKLMESNSPSNTGQSA